MGAAAVPRGPGTVSLTGPGAKAAACIVVKGNRGSVLHGFIFSWFKIQLVQRYPAIYVMEH